MSNASSSARRAGRGAAAPLGFLRAAACLVIGLILIGMVVFGTNTFFLAKKAITRYSPLVLVAALVLAAAASWLVVSCGRGAGASRPAASDAVAGRTSDKAFRIYLIAGSLVLLALQMLVVYGARFTTGWDVRVLMTSAQDVADIVPYLDVYPNNEFIYSLFTGLDALGSLVGIGRYGVLTVVSCVLVNVSLVFMALVARRLFGTRVAVCSHVVASVLIGLSPWILVPYSDTYSILMPIMALWFYTCVDHRCARAFGCGFCSIIGYFIKPTSIFVLMAVAFVEAVCWMAQRVSARRQSRAAGETGAAPDAVAAAAAAAGVAPAPVAGPSGAVASAVATADGPSRRRNTLSIACAVVVAAVLAFGIKAASTAWLPPLNEDAALSMTHFLMMGAAENTGGMWNGDDIAASTAIADPAERTRMNIDKFVERVTTRTPLENARFYGKKILSTFDDGTFSWKEEGTSFFLGSYGRIPALQRYFGIPDLNPDAGFAFQAVSQTIWYAVLAGVALCAFAGRRCGGGSLSPNADAVSAPSRPAGDGQTLRLRKAEVVALLCLIAIALFLTIFECRGRYLILYVPFFVMLGTAGWLRAVAALRTRPHSRAAVQR